MTTKLPNINQRDGISLEDTSNDIKSQTHQHAKTEYYSPFRLPGDDEVFVYRELERKKREEIKALSQDLKIWDKKIGTSKRPLRLFKGFEPTAKENIKVFGHAGFSVKDKTMIVEAQRIINERRKYKDFKGKEHKEGIVELLEQKKEMFLVERTVGIIEKEKEVLIEKAAEKDDALKKSDEMLEKDWKEFEAYKQNNKQETDLAIQRYNQEVDARKRTETLYKIKNNDLTSIKAEKTKNEELIQKYHDAKTFLQKLTPKEFLEQRAREVRERIEEFKSQWIDRELLNKEETISSIVSTDNLSKVASNRDKKPLGGKRNFRPELEKLFQEKLKKGEFDEIEEFRLNQKMYFTDTNQLIELFMRFEERNLALIQMMQDTEQNLENLKNTLKQKKAEFDKKIGGLRENKALLEKNKHEKEEKVKILEQRAKEPKLAKKYDGLIPLRKKIIEIVSLFKDESKAAIDQDNLPTLDLLASIELHLEKQLEKLNEFKPSKVVELKRQFEDVRKRANRKLQQEREQKLAEEKSRKASERAMEKSKKRGGRPPMTKSTPLQKKEVVVQVASNTEEEEDMKYFTPYLTKF